VLERRRDRTKILATLGPATATPAKVRELVKAGVDAVRLNMSHGDAASFKRWASIVRSVRREMDRPISILVDLRGPRIRLGTMSEPRLLKRGEIIGVVSHTHAKDGDLPIDYLRLLGDVGPGQRILVRDGRVELKVLKRIGQRLICKVLRGDIVSSNQGVNLPDSEVSETALSAKDRADVRLAVEMKADWVALSFVRTGDDVRALRRELAKLGSRMPIVSKIEHPQALEHLDEILEETDAVMIARGDLAVEVGHALVPTIQKRIVRACIQKATPVIVATQMLESMLEASQPTRAEVSDVANAVLDGVDAVMLSGETAVGKFPIETCRTMRQIIHETEKGLFHDTWRLRPSLRPTGKRGQVLEAATMDSAVTLAERAEARTLLAFTESGRSVRLVSAFRPRLPIVALTSREETFQQMALYWGVMPGRLPRVKRIREMNRAAHELLLEHKLLGDQDLLVVVTGTFAVSGATNTVRLIRLADLT
jgi:pyruvate kinase